MGALEIILLAAGAVIFIVSFCIPVKQEKLKEETRNLAAEEVKALVSDELERVRGRLSELSEEEMKLKIEKSERSMERISNEKIMAVNEYSDTVLDEIHKNHEEVVFLYDMLKDKRESLRESYEKADRNIRDLLQQVKDSEITVREGLAEISGKQRALQERGGRETASVFAAQGRGFGVNAAQDGRTEPQSAVLTAGKDGLPDRRSALEMLERKAADSRRKEAEVSEFQPFVAEKIDVVPKKKTGGKSAKKRTPDEEQETVPAVDAVREQDAAKGQETSEGQETPKEQTSGKKTKAKAPAKERKKEAEKGEAEEKREAEPFAGETELALLLAGAMEDGSSNSNQRILELHKAGKSNMAIARELGLGLGEVKLVIDLYEGLR